MAEWSNNVWVGMVCFACAGLMFGVGLGIYLERSNWKCRAAPGSEGGHYCDGKMYAVLEESHFLAEYVRKPDRGRDYGTPAEGSPTRLRARSADTDTPVAPITAGPWSFPGFPLRVPGTVSILSIPPELAPASGVLVVTATTGSVVPTYRQREVGA